MADPVLGSDNATSGGVIYSTPAYALGGFSFSSVNGGFNFDMPLATVAMFNNQALQFAGQSSARNQQFLDQTIKASQASAKGTEAQLFGFLNSGINKIFQASRNSADYGYKASIYGQDQATERARINVENTRAANSGGWCYITTAICELDGLPDDCDTLQTFRKFRDEYMLADPKLAKQVDDYYEQAPKICARLAKLPDGGREILTALKNQYLMMALDFIKKGDNESALYVYQQMVIAADAVSRGAK